MVGRHTDTSLLSFSKTPIHLWLNYKKEKITSLRLEVIQVSLVYWCSPITGSRGRGPFLAT